MNMAMTLCLIIFLDYRPFFEELYIEYNPTDTKTQQKYFAEQTEFKQFFNEIISKCHFRMEKKSPTQLYFFYLNTKLLQSTF
jgi:hypothetical protein